jgi:hypothetical protein
MNKIHFLSLLISMLSHSLFAQSSEPVEIVVPKKIERFIDGYVQAWSRGDVKYIMDNVYDVPFSIIDGDSTTVFNVSANLENFLVETFKSLKNQGYGYSKRNKWERFEYHSDSKITITQNYTRYLTTGEIMGVIERRATYIIQKNGKSYRITQLIRNK